MRQVDGSDLLRSGDPRNIEIGIIYVEAEDRREEIRAAINAQERLGRKQIAIVLPDQGKAFRQPAEFDSLVNMRRSLQAQLIIIAALGHGPAEFARRRRLRVYPSVEAFRIALLREQALNPPAQAPSDERRQRFLNRAQRSQGHEQNPPATSQVSPEVAGPANSLKPSIPPTQAVPYLAPRSASSDPTQLPGASTPPEVINTQQQFGNYRLTDQMLGKGGFAKVYLGKHIYLDTYAAIKVLASEQIDAKAREDFIREARTLANLIHPNIVRLLDFGIQENTPFLVMEYAPGKSLRDIHPRGSNLPLETVIHYAHQVAEALQFAHGQRFIHRDIKPQNMLIGQNGLVQVADFGIALSVQGSRALNTQETIGTVHYMAPEQILGKPHLASDQYALAIVIYEWLSGEPPFQGNALEVYGQHLHAPVPSLRIARPDLPATIETILLKALTKTPEERFPTISKFIEVLEHASKTSANHAQTPGNEGIVVPAFLGSNSPEGRTASLNTQALEDMYNAVRQGKITDPETILALARNFEALESDPVANKQIPFNAARAASTLRQRVQQFRDRDEKK